MIVAVRPPEQRFLVDGVCWTTYQTVGKAFADRPALRMTYDQGALELMTTSPEHEIYKKRLGRFFEIMAEEFHKPFATAGNMTFQKEDLDRGFEADDCFWITHEPHMRGKRTWDSKLDPPPDVTLEIEVSRSALDRLGICAAFRIPEVWCFDGQTLRVLRLRADGSYEQVETSGFFPGIRLDDLLPFLQALDTQDVLTVTRAFRQWLREQLGKST